MEAELLHQNIFELDNQNNKFDIVICHDVIEHISDKEALISKLQYFIKDDGVVFISFPAWQMPFGGHQQIARSWVISHTPFIHLLPSYFYKGVLSLFKEAPACISELLDIKKTKCSIEKFERSVSNTNVFRCIDRRFYFINPHYEIKFKLKPRRLFSFIENIPYIRNFFTTSCFYMFEKK